MKRSDFPFVSVIMPIRNEGRYIDRCLRSVLCQDYPHERMEVLLVDGMSDDNTRQLARQCLAESTLYAFKILDNPERNISDALNLGIRAARGEVILRVDGHTVLAANYISRCVHALSETGADNVGGPMRAVGETMMGRAIALATGSPFGVGNARFHYADQAGWVDTVYMGAFHRSVFTKIGMFDPELVRNQDDEFNFRMTRAGGRIWLDPEIVSTYYARGSLTALARQYFAYGFWKVRVIQKHGRPASWRHLVPITFLVALVSAMLLGLVISSWLPLATILVPYLLVASAFAFSIARATRWRYLPLVPLAFPTMHLSYGFGFLAGILRFAARPGLFLSKRMNKTEWLRAHWSSRRLLVLKLAATLTLFLPAPWLVVGYLWLLGYLAVRWWLLGKPVSSMGINPFILLVLVGVCLGLLATPIPIAGAVRTANVLAAITCLYILTDFIQTPDDAWLVAAGLVVPALGIVALIPFDVEWSLNKVYPLPWLSQFTPPSAGFNPNLIAGMLAVILPFAVALVFSRRWRILGIVALAPLVLSLIVLQSRGALFGVAGGIALAAAAFARWLVLLLVLFVFAGLAANYLLGGPSLVPYILGRVGTATSGTTIERIALWQQATDLIRAHPLTGIGIAAYPSVARYAPPHSILAPGPFEPHAHNLFLQVALDTGLAGLAGYLLVLFSAVRSVWGAHERGIVSPLALAVLAALGVAVVHGQVDSIFWGNKGTVILWVVIALAVALEHLGPADSPPFPAESKG